jgi:hypothetical protein
VNRTYKLRKLRNSGAAYRRFHGGLMANAHEVLVALMRHKVFGGLIVLMGTAGLIGGLITFWPR